LLVLDTHVAVGWAGDPQRLGRGARARIAAADRLGIPAIVFWEIALLVRKRKLDLGMPVSTWMRAIQAVPRVDALPLTAEIAVDGAASRRATRQRGRAHALVGIRRDRLVTRGW
jgi:PIN domain nuclease of toxin-antitoxin system